jgi:hypothetical protein
VVSADSVTTDVRRRDFYAIDAADPFRLQITWEKLDDGF